MKKYKVTFMYMGSNHEWIDWFSFTMEAASERIASEAAHAMLNKEEHENCTARVEEIK